MTEEDNITMKKPVVYMEKAWKRILSPANIFNNGLNILI